jgi:hypothetical protein
MVLIYTGIDVVHAVDEFLQDLSGLHMRTTIEPSKLNILIFRRACNNLNMHLNIWCPLLKLLN